MAFNVWRSFSTRIKRLITIAIFFFLSLALTIAGASTPLTHSEAQDIKQEFDKMRENASVQFIFGNNFLLCLSFFIPVFGPVFGCYVLYSTGVVIAADSIIEGVHPLVSFLLLFIFPFTWLEFLAYSTAFSQSVWLIWRVIKRQWKREIVNTCIFISICAVMLLAAAIIEMAIILAFTPVP
ncbi:MAG: stage II sporulation protein M [Candidatus Bathyarchaeia archaeon]